MPTHEFRYMAPALALVAYGLLIVACLVGIAVFSSSEPVLAIGCGLGTLLLGRRAVFHHTHRLRIEADALVMTSAFGTRRIEFDQIRSLSLSRHDSGRDETVLTLATPGPELVLTQDYAHFEDLEPLLRARLPKVPVRDSRPSELR